MLDQLPLDILFCVTKHYLDFQTAIALSSTTSSLHASIDPNTLCSREAKTAFYIRAEHFPQHAAKLACFFCWRLLPSTSFGDSHRRGPRGKFSKNTPRKSKRACWDCAIARNQYAHLKGVKKDGLTYYPCHVCRRPPVNPKKQCSAIWNLQPASGLRPGVWGRYRQTVLLADSGKDTICWNDDQPMAAAAKIEQLPDKVLEQIFGMCDYGDLIRLRHVNRFFKEKVNPVKHCKSIFSMYNFTLTKWQESQRGRRVWDVSDWGRPCFGCFRKREYRHFSKEQWRCKWDVRDYRCWRARCWECLRKFYHPELGDKESRKRFERQWMCEWCDCLRFDDEECEGCVVKADMAGRRKEKERQRVDAITEAENDLAVWFESVGVSEADTADDI